MSLVHASRLLSSRGKCLRSSYVEISRFFSTRHHGIAANCSNTCTKQAARAFSSSKVTLNAIEPDEKLRKTLDEFKATSMLYPLKYTFKYSHTIVKTTPWKVISLKQAQIGEQIEIAGYLSTRRDVNKKMAFTMFRDHMQSCCIQLVSTSNVPGGAAEAHERLRTLKEWTPVLIRGTVKERDEARTITHLGVDLVRDRELAVEYVEPLNHISDDIIIKHDTVFSPEQRHLQLRTNPDLRSDILWRSIYMGKTRSHLQDGYWQEIETPILFKSTPEGAREFLVPTRQKGLAYALPQSPQQYKQILMASGIRRYFQFARCFRDEDLRADRQPEFTQLDMEMAFAGEKDIMAEIESLLQYLWTQSGRPIKTFQRMTYHDAMATYGSDKPDLRYEATVNLISKITPLQDPIVDAFKISISSNPKSTRKFIASFLDSPDGKVYLDNANGQPGIFVGDHSQPMQGLGPLGYPFVMEGPEALQTEHGDLLVIQARPNAPLSGGSTVLGNLRLALYKAAISQGLIDAPDPSDFRFLWITDFPLFTPNNDSDPGQGGSAGFSSTHHPFTAPKTPEDVDLLLTDPSRATAAHYDIVVNGIELGGGSRRIHNAAVQEFIFRDVLKMRPERIEDFRHLLDVLASGCPPHAGIALGWDRLIAVLRGKESVRDVIAFPKSGRGEDMLVGSPNRVTEEQWGTYHLKVNE
ncbi:aspartyl-tRNA synthetase-like protein [Phaeosphaeria sp. MPI-PUGE-AT-0046c]|nr:aspartyl-tRNA synthetase-like protein [Phaeosphaeria sp. MPI-PUGE-AT-0046c]